jgi:copper transport protein
MAAVSRRGHITRALLAATVAALLFPATAGAHASLLRTSPSASGVLNAAPGSVALTYSEAVEPRFAVVSVTNADGKQEATAPPHRSPANAAQLVVPLSHLAKGWYLVFWRAISVDGHPVRGAFTFAVGPNPGPAPQFPIPSLRETAATAPLLAARWVVFLSTMSAIGLLVFRLLVLRVLFREIPEISLRALTRAVAVAFGIALLAVPIYADLSTAQFALRSAFDFGNVLPLMADSAFGRAYLDLEIVLALLALSGAIALFLERPDRRERSVAELLALMGVVAGIAATLAIPGLAGHAAEKSPRGLSLAMDWTHMLAGSIWIGGLIGLTVIGLRIDSARRVRAFTIVVPRFSRIAFVAVAVLIASGTVAAFTRLPTLGTLWSTAYGQALVAKIVLLSLALPLAAVNMLRNKPGLVSGQEETSQRAGKLLRGLVGGEVTLVVGAIFAAGLLSSLPPPSSALAHIGNAAAKVGPGTVKRTVTHGPYRLSFQISPNRAAVPNAFAVKIARQGKPVTGADVVANFTMLDMEMQSQAYRLAERGPALYTRSAPSLVMVGHWALSFKIAAPGASPFDVLLLDKAGG